MAQARRGNRVWSVRVCVCWPAHHRGCKLSLGVFSTTTPTNFSEMRYTGNRASAVNTLSPPCSLLRYWSVTSSPNFSPTRRPSARHPEHARRMSVATFESIQVALSADSKLGTKVGGSLQFVLTGGQGGDSTWVVDCKQAKVRRGADMCTRATPRPRRAGHVLLRHRATRSGACVARSRHRAW